MTDEPTSGQAPQDITAQQLPPHALRWAIKQSFVGYVSRMPDGRAYVSGGAGVTELYEFVFPLEENGDHTTGDGRTFAFGGHVTFTGHFGMLWVQIKEPRITVGAQEAELTVADPESKDGGRLRLATLGLTGPVADHGTQRWEAADVRLTPDGVALFGDVYQPGEPMEPLTLTVPA